MGSGVKINPARIYKHFVPTGLLKIDGRLAIDGLRCPRKNDGRIVKREKDIKEVKVERPRRAVVSEKKP